MPPPTRWRTPGADGNGVTKTVNSGAFSVGPDVYITHRPSGENVGDRAKGPFIVMPPNGASFPSCSVHNSAVAGEVCTTNKRVLPSGDQEAGACVVPGFGFVSFSAAAPPSVRCRQMASSPSWFD